MPSSKKSPSKRTSSGKKSSGRTSSRRRTVVKISQKGLWRATLVIALVCAGILAVTLSSFRDKASAYLKNVHANFEKTEADLGLENGITHQDVPVLMDNAATTAEQLAQNGTITDYEVGDNCVYMETTDGVGMVYAPIVADTAELTEPAEPAEPIVTAVQETPAQTDAVEETPASVTPAATETPLPSVQPGVSPNILCLQPCYDLFLSSFSKDELESVDQAAFRFAEAYDRFTFDPAVSDLDNQQVTPETILTFPDYDIIIWEGHGSYTDTTHSFLFTGQPYNDSYYAQHESDFKNGYLLATTNGYVAVTAGYFDAYLAPGSLDGAIIYLAACSSCRDDTLVRTLLSKGARAVYGADGIIYTSYNYAVLDWISIDLCGYNGKVMSTGEALEDAQATYGYLDNYLLTPEPGADTNGTVIKLFGDPSYRLS
ncbi:MAG: hypothetical protein IJJ34_05830 [Clostridia bacterium]|nr:hypothetical protein [Clostridia bacterium]